MQAGVWDRAQELVEVGGEEGRGDGGSRGEDDYRESGEREEEDRRGAARWRGRDFMQAWLAFGGGQAGFLGGYRPAGWSYSGPGIAGPKSIRDVCGPVDFQ